MSQPANKDPDLEAGQIDPYSEAPAGVLHDIALKCGTKVWSSFFFLFILLAPIYLTS